MNFCRRCGAKLVANGERVFQCVSGHTIYFNSAPAADVFLMTPDNKVWLAVRGEEPYKGSLDAPGGFVDNGESFEEAAVRELREELGLEPNDYEPLNYLTSSFSDSYCYEGETTPVVTVFFYSRLKTNRPLKPADDVAAVRLFSIDDIDMNDINLNDVRHGLRKLQNMLQ